MTWLRTTQELQDQLNTKVSLSDPRLSDARTASDVSNWAKQSEKPTYTFTEITIKPTTLSGYGITDAASLTHNHDSSYVTKNAAIAPSTGTKVTYDAKGLVTSSTALSASDIPSLDASKITTGTIDQARLPSYVDDVLEYNNLASFPATGSTGKIYVAIDTNKTYRWSGSAYIYITSGAVDSVAGKTGVVTLSKSDVGLNNVDNTADSSKSVLSATKLTTGRTVNMTGDVSWTSSSFDGTSNVTGVGTLANSGVTAGTYNNVATEVRPYTVDAKGRITGVGAAVTITPAWGSVTGKPTTLSGYGITDGVVNTDLRLSDARPASDVSNWAKSPTKPEYGFSEITNKPTTIAGYGITDAPIVNQKAVRVFKFGTYDGVGGWLAGNDSSMFGGQSPSTWSDGNGQASGMQHTAGVFQTIFGTKVDVGANANISSDTWYSYSSTNGKFTAALLRIKNTTAAAINWILYFYGSSYSAWNEYSSVALNGTSILYNGTANVNILLGVNMSIPANRTSTLVIVTASTAPSGSLRTNQLIIANNCLNLPSGLELVDDLYSLPSTYDLKLG